MRLHVGHQHSQFRPILARFLDYYSLFWGPGVISTINEPPGVHLRVGHQQSQFWPILARFVDYYSLFWGPRVISMINEPQGAFPCQSSTLTVLADYGPFHGQLLTVLRSQIDFHGCGPPGCAYMSVINTRSFDRFWPVSWIITNYFWVPE